MEQVLAVAAEKTAKQKMYALVDQKRELAPPGPVYVRAPDDGWQKPIRDLMRRAYAVILWLPPDQDLHPSFNWEIEQVALDRLQTRTIIVLPPPITRRRTSGASSRQQSCGLSQLLAIVGKELAGQPFSVRYPSHEPGSRAETAAH